MATVSKIDNNINDQNPSVTESKLVWDDILTQSTITTDYTTNTYPYVQTSSAYSYINSNITTATSTSTGDYNYYDYYTLQHTLKDLIKDEIDKYEENNKKMSSEIKFDFGPVTDDSIRYSPYGMAIKNNEGKYVCYDYSNGKIIDVDIFNFNAKSMFYKVPKAFDDITIGDIVQHQKKWMFVQFVHEATLDVVDISSGEVKNIIPTSSPFGYDYITTVVNVMDLFGCDKPSKDNPFGSMLPFLMMGNKEIDMSALMMMGMMGNNAKIDPAMMILMSKDNNDMLRNYLLFKMLKKKECCGNKKKNS